MLTNESFDRHTKNSEDMYSCAGGPGREANYRRIVSFLHSFDSNCNQAALPTKALVV